MAGVPSFRIPSAPGFDYIFNCNLAELVVKVELHISCNNLKDRDVFSKSDPMAVLFSEHRINDELVWKEIDRTEVIRDSLNPSFAKSFIIEYHFEQIQKLKFEVYDIDSASFDLCYHDYLGYTIVSLGSIIGECGGMVKKPLLGKNGKPIGSDINFVAEEVCDNKEIVTLQMQARKLNKKHFLGRPNPFLVFSRKGIDNDQFIAVHRSTVIQSNLNPSWECFNIPLTSLCNGDKHRLVKIECYDYSYDGSHSLIGETDFTVNEVLTEPTLSKHLRHPKKLKKKNYVHSGSLEFGSILLKNEASFLEYIFGGVELCVHVAIDFTASNGNPQHPSSLHFIDDQTPNRYVQALTAIGEICEDYDTDKMIPAYGFGAKINGHVYHDFHLNQNDDPHCHGISGVLDAYEKVIPNIELYGPTNFAPVINLVMGMAKRQQRNKKYHILLILTDGEITDLEQTKSTIVKASQLPISIIIIGIGDADFKVMDVLDGDKHDLMYQNQKVERDIVQFVPFNKFSGSFAAEDLAKEVLYEVPHQLVSYMTKNDIRPDTTTFSPQLCLFNKNKERDKALKRPVSVPNMKKKPEFRTYSYCKNDMSERYVDESLDKKSSLRTSTISAKEYALQTLAQYNNKF